MVNEAWHLCQTLPVSHTAECDEVCLTLILRITQLHLKVQDYKKLEEFAEILLEFSRKVNDTEREISALIHLAIARGVASDYKTAMPYFIEALEKSQAMGLRYIAANCLINIGNIYANFFNYEEALERYNRVLNEYADILSAETEVTINVNTGNLYYASEQFSLSLDFLIRASRLAEKLKSTPWVAYIYALKSRTLLAMNRNESAVADAHKAAELMRNLNISTRGRQINLLNLAQIDFQTADTEGATQRALRGIAMARRVHDDTSEVRGFKLLADIYKQQKHYKKALRCQTIYAEKQADYLKTQRNMHTLDLEIRYALREKTK
ncbi:MAG: tetratricopeptide repeat protein [Saprospiraceae bacterium]|nr:tetratricopeptide repeat protein [Saprospiraceae bacterium]